MAEQNDSGVPLQKVPRCAAAPGRQCKTWQSGPHTRSLWPALSYNSTALHGRLWHIVTTMVVDCPSAYVVDGDSLRCGSERLRLLGIDAPELHGCPKWRTCVVGDGEASKDSLRQALRYGPVRYRVVTRDRFGRRVVMAWAGKVNLSCWQLQRAQAVYKPKWDNGEMVARACR
jgi:micrococcal nuclease